MSNLTVFNYNGQIISRRENGFVNLTQMCQANGKRLKDFLSHKRTLETIHTLYAIQSGEIYHVLETIDGETWGHFDLAAELAYQSNASFSVWFNITFYGDNLTFPSVSLEEFRQWEEKHFPWINDATNKNEQKGSVYFILNETRNILKIGYTAGDPMTRLAAFKSGAVQEKLTLLGQVDGTLKTEGMYHSYLASYKVQGEWFNYTPDVRKFVEETILGG